MFVMQYLLGLINAVVRSPGAGHLSLQNINTPNVTDLFHLIANFLRLCQIQAMGFYHRSIFSRWIVSPLPDQLA